MHRPAELDDADRRPTTWLITGCYVVGGDVWSWSGSSFETNPPPHPIHVESRWERFRRWLRYWRAP